MTTSVWMEARCDVQDGVNCWAGDEGCFSSSVSKYLSSIKVDGWKFSGGKSICPSCADVKLKEPKSCE